MCLAAADDGMWQESVVTGLKYSGQAEGLVYGAMAEVTKQLRVLKLTVDDLVGAPEKAGPMDDLAEKLLALK